METTGNQLSVSMEKGDLNVISAFFVLEKVRSVENGPFISL